MRKGKKREELPNAPQAILTGLAACPAGNMVWWYVVSSDKVIRTYVAVDVSAAGPGAGGWAH